MSSFIVNHVLNTTSTLYNQQKKSLEKTVQELENAITVLKEKDDTTAEVLREKVAILSQEPV